jgi:hypothetical protein
MLAIAINCAGIIARPKPLAAIHEIYYAKRSGQRRAVLGIKWSWKKRVIISRLAKIRLSSEE